MATRDEPVRLLIVTEPHGYEIDGLPVFHGQGDIVTSGYRYLAGREMCFTPLTLVIKGESLPPTEATVTIISEDQVSGGVGFARVQNIMPIRPVT
jgi:hypothetical protein